MPVWQELREELKDKNFEIITVACDTKGATVAESWIRAANPQHPSLIDTRHRVPELYGTRNVPAAFWIDEEGRIVRANDPIYIQRRNRETGETTTNEKYLNAVRDWVAKGPKSIYVENSKEALAHLGHPTKDDAQAMAYFRLATYLDQQGHSREAIVNFKQAQVLRPQNWNFKRQAWSLGDIKSDYGTTFQETRQDPASQPLYPPLDLPDLPSS